MVENFLYTAEYVAFFFSIADEMVNFICICFFTIPLLTT